MSSCIIPTDEEQIDVSSKLYELSNRVVNKNIKIAQVNMCAYHRLFDATSVMYGFLAEQRSCLVLFLKFSPTSIDILK
jgi:hypothetical protein